MVVGVLRSYRKEGTTSERTPYYAGCKRVKIVALARVEHLEVGAEGNTKTKTDTIGMCPDALFQSSEIPRQRARFLTLDG